MSREPYKLDGPNLYQYGFNDPINGYDEDGLWTLSISLGVAGGLGAGGGFEGSLNIDGQGNISLSGTVSGGGYGGLNGGAAISGTITKASSVCQLNGKGGKIGADIGPVGAAYITNPNNDYHGGSLSLGGKGFGGLYGFVTGTGTWFSINPLNGMKNYYYGLEQSIKHLYQ